MIRLDGVNLAFQLPGDYRLVRRVAEDSDGAAYIEARNRQNRPINIKAILGPNWAVGQNVASGSLSGTAIALRRKGKVRRRRPIRSLLRLVQINKGNREVQARYLRTMPCRDEDGSFTKFVVHIPLASSGKQAEALRVVEREWRSTPGRKVLFADCNGSPAGFAATIGAPFHSGDGVMVWCWSRGWDDVRVSWSKVAGSDHKRGTFRAGR